MGISSFVRQGNGCAGVYESGMAKGNFLSRARGRGRLSGFYCEVPAILIDINGSSDRE
jgi:hypothetical protein